jgi:hypothetical protein
VQVWPPGTVGEAFERFRSTGEWHDAKKARTREDWERGWKHIAPAFGDWRPGEITLELVSIWYRGDPDDENVKGLLQTIGIREAHRAMKIWRALWRVMVALRYTTEGDPSQGVRRITPRGRSAKWEEGEVVRLVKRAWRMGFRGLACIIAVAWDTQFSPVDARSLTARRVREHRGRLIFDLAEHGREKTEKGVIGTLSRRTESLVRAYLVQRYGGADLLPDMVLFRSRNSAQAPDGATYDKDSLARDFRKVRAAEFGIDEARQLQDMRRSGAIEAAAGEVDPSVLSRKMGNTIDKSAELMNTYVPAQVGIARIADEARLRGRRRLRGDG